MTLANEFKNMDEKEILEELRKKIIELDEKGLQDTPEYIILSEQWQDLAINWVIGDILGDDAS